MARYLLSQIHMEDPESKAVQEKHIKDATGVAYVGMF